VNVSATNQEFHPRGWPIILALSPRRAWRFKLRRRMMRLQTGNPVRLLLCCFNFERAAYLKFGYLIGGEPVDLAQASNDMAMRKQS
jgi:hypothetical protein